MNKALATSLIIIALVVGLATGFFLTPEYATMREEKAAGMMELGKADSFVDLRYIDGMIAHHKAAIFMSQQAVSKTRRPEVKTLSQAIITADEKGIADLYLLKKEWYQNSREVTKFNKVNLGEGDDKFDLRFINAMLEHHMEAIDVAKDVRTKSTRTETLNIADTVITSLSENAEVLEGWRASWYGNP